MIKKTFVDISNDIRVIMMTRVACIKKKDTSIKVFSEHMTKLKKMGFRHGFAKNQHTKSFDRNLKSPEPSPRTFDATGTTFLH
jgi:hypothetical protein